MVVLGGGEGLMSEVALYGAKTPTAATEMKVRVFRIEPKIACLYCRVQMLLHAKIARELLLSVLRTPDTARYGTKGSNGSNSHPKAGLSWPMSYP